MHAYIHTCTCIHIYVNVCSISVPTLRELVFLLQCFTLHTCNTWDTIILKSQLERWNQVKFGKCLDRTARNEFCKKNVKLTSFSLENYRYSIDFCWLTRLSKLHFCERRCFKDVSTTQGLRLEISPNSEVGFGYFLHARGLSLEISPNSAVELGDFSKLGGWVWRILQTPHLGPEFKVSWSADWPGSPNCTSVNAGVLKILLQLKDWDWRFLQTPRLGLDIFSTLGGWVWRFLQIRRLSLENSPNSGVEFGEFSKLRTWARVQSQFGEFFNFKKKCKVKKYSITCKIFKNMLITHCLIFLSLENSLNSTPEFGEISKFNPQVWRNLQAQPPSLKKYPDSTPELGQISRLNSQVWNMKFEAWSWR